MSVTTQGDPGYVTYSVLFQVSAFTFDSCRPKFGGVLTELLAEFYPFISFQGSCQYTQQTRLWI